MAEKYYIEDTNQEKVEFSKAFNRVLNIGILITFFHLVIFLYSIFYLHDYVDKLFIKNNLSTFVTDALYYLSVGISFIGLIHIKSDKKPFSKLFSKYLIFIGLLWVVASFIIGHLPGYFGRLKMVHINNITFIDGKTFSVGIIIVILGFLMKYAYQYQINDEETV